MTSHAKEKMSLCWGEGSPGRDAGEDRAGGSALISIHSTFSLSENMLLKISCKPEVWNIQIFTHCKSGVEVGICGEGATKIMKF